MPDVSSFHRIISRSLKTHSLENTRKIDLVMKMNLWLMVCLRAPLCKKANMGEIVAVLARREEIFEM